VENDAAGCFGSLSVWNWTIYPRSFTLCQSRVGEGDRVLRGYSRNPKKQCGGYPGWSKLQRSTQIPPCVADMSAVDRLPNGSTTSAAHNSKRGPEDGDVERDEDDFDRPISPLHMPPGQIDGLESLKVDGFTNRRGQSPHRKNPSNSSLLHLPIPLAPSPAQLAFSALQYLPYPLMVLDGLKTLVMANEAMGRLLDIKDTDGDVANDDGLLISDRLRGQTLSQLGIDMLQDGRPVWVTWESFLENLAEDMGTHAEGKTTQLGSESGEGVVTPTAERNNSFGTRLASKNESMVHDAVVEVVLTPQVPTSQLTHRTNHIPKLTFAKMIITVWEIEDGKFFSLTFTSTDSNQSSLPSSTASSRQVTKTSKDRYLGSSSTGSGSASHSSPSSVSSGRSPNQEGSSSSSALTSPTYASMSASPFPPLRPPSRNSLTSGPSVLQKVVMMKEALLDNTQTPIAAMWTDESLIIPNKAARRLWNPSADLTQIKDGADLLMRWHVWDETFTTRLDPSEYPISILVKTQTPFSSRKIGLIDPETDRKMVFDCLGEAIRDENTGEFLAGMVTCRDITEVTQQISDIKEKDEQRFQLICDSMPQMIWTATPDGMHDWFSQRWYDYTGLTEEESLGMGWQLPFHPEDILATEGRWQHSLATGAPYSTEYRCRNKNGEWRWMLGRALPMRNKQTGAIEKWFGTYTDIHESVEARFAYKQMVR
jgi:PAS domain S-box-containing protein